MEKQLGLMGLAQAAEAIAQGTISCEELTQASLQRITQIEPQVGAWAFLDPQHALKQAHRADRVRRTGRDTGPLHGVPVGLADVFDSQDMPCERGSALYTGRRCGADAQVVELLRAAGAIVPGKCATSELGLFVPGKTHHPQATEHKLWGSAAGAAAAVASGMLAGAVAVQTEGALIQAAAQCGIVAYMPSAGLISRRGAWRCSSTLDRVGVLTRTLHDAALLAQTLMAYDQGDDMPLHARPRLVKSVHAQPPVPPRFGIVHTPWWASADTAMQGGIEELLAALSPHADSEPFELGPAYAQMPTGLHTVLTAEFAHHLSTALAASHQTAAVVSELVQAQLDAGQAVPATEYLRVLDDCKRLSQQLEEVFIWCDALLTPADHGAIDLNRAEPLPVFALPWHMLGLPTVTLPLFTNAAGLPMGLQLVGAPLGDGRLLRTANWLLQQLVDTQ